MLMIVLDVTIVNVALPSIQDDLGFSQSSLALMVNAYLISFGGLLLLAGRLGDIIGRANIYLAGLAVFTVASLLCGRLRTRGCWVAHRGTGAQGRADGLRARRRLSPGVPDRRWPGGAGDDGGRGDRPRRGQRARGRARC
jgi:hypothetical protein